MNQTTNTDSMDIDANASPTANASQIIQTLLKFVQNVMRNGLKLFADAHRDYSIVSHQSQALYREASQQFEHFQATIKATPRFKKIVGTSLKMIASYRTHEVKARYLSEETAKLQLQEIHELNAWRLYDLCIELRGGILKLGQFISCRMDLLPTPYIEALSQLQDKVPSIPADVIIARIDEELGQPLESVFESFDREPLAAASLAQVHKAVLHNGKEVAVKVRVPGIEDIIHIDLTAAKSVSWLLKDMLRQFDVPTIIDELKRSVTEELDYRIEATNMETFRQQHGHRTDIIIPTIEKALCTEKLLVMELIDGVKLTDFCTEATERDDLEALGKVLGTLVDSFCSQIIEHGSFHADPHPGNFLVTNDNRLAILDFGSVRTFDDSERIAYSELTTAIIMQDQNKMVELLEAMHFKTANGNPDTLFQFADVFLGLFRESMSADISTLDPKEQMSQLMALVQKNPVVEIPGNFVMLGRVFSYLGGLLYFYKPQINLFNIISPYVVRAE